jgi:hypothetical protein
MFTAHSTCLEFGDNEQVICYCRQAGSQHGSLYSAVSLWYERARHTRYSLDTFLLRHNSIGKGITLIPDQSLNQTR